MHHSNVSQHNSKGCHCLNVVHTSDTGLRFSINSKAVLHRESNQHVQFSAQQNKEETARCGWSCGLCQVLPVDVDGALQKIDVRQRDSLALGKLALASDGMR
jgi:hypothetical protein